MSEHTTTVVADVNRKTGETNNKAWTRYSLKDDDGNWYSTFESGLISSDLKGQRVSLEWEQNGDFKTLLKVSPADDSPIAARTPDGDADWDLIGLRKTRCALWSAYLPGALEQAFQYWASVQTDPPGTADIAHFLVRFGKQLVVAAEADIFQREPAGQDEDVPF